MSLTQVGFRRRPHFCGSCSDRRQMTGADFNTAADQHGAKYDG